MYSVFLCRTILFFPTSIKTIGRSTVSRLYERATRVCMTHTPLYLILGDLNRRDHHRLDGRVARAGRRALDRVDDVLALDDLAEDRVL